MNLTPEDISLESLERLGLAIAEHARFCEQYPPGTKLGVAMAKIATEPELIRMQIEGNHGVTLKSTQGQFRVAKDAFINGLTHLLEALR